ncbi:MAG TPA: sigma-70 family RNA polymerase sigma factor [Thermomicrobiales bacterium]|nr:sigma-70 family RNA polymerase sigma factor [Thermomicrobiales bacterium]
MDRRREDEAAYEWFFRTEYPAVLKTAYLVTHDRETARDVTQEAFIQLLRHWRKVSHYERPDAWVRRVAIRIAVRQARKLRLQRSTEVEPPAPAPVQMDPDLVREIRALPAMQRAAIVLFYFEDRPVSEIAEILDCAPSTAKVHLHRARKTLAERLGEVMADVT